MNPGGVGAAASTCPIRAPRCDWANIVKPAMERHPLALLFFLPFILIATFVVLNLFIGVIVEGIQSLREEREAAGIAEVREEAHADAAALMREIKALRAEVAALRVERAGGGGG